MFAFSRDWYSIAELGLDYKNNLNQFFVDPWLTQNGRNNQGNLYQQTSTEFAWLSEQTLNYTKNFNQHHFSALAGFAAQESRYDQTTISASQLDTQFRHDKWEQMFLRSHIKPAPSKWVGEAYYFGRITYDYAGRYLLQVNLHSG